MPLQVSSTVLLYADDSKISRRINSAKGSNTLQNDFDNTVKYSERWLLRFNIPKCKVMYVSNVSNADEHSCYTMSGSKSNIVTKLSETVFERDLGISMFSKFSIQVEKAVSKAKLINYLA